jgi:hypothetical protein
MPQTRPPREVNPSDRNPYNDPDYSPFLITHNPAGAAQGGLLGRLLAVLAEQNTSRDDNSIAAPSEAVPPQEDRPVRILARRAVR